MGRKVTAREVAGAAGVSPATVDRVLNSRGGVHPDKEAAVIAAALRLGLDRALHFRMARTLHVAVLLQAPANPFHAVVQGAFLDANRSHAALNLQFRIYHAIPTDISAISARILALSRSHAGLVLVCPDAPEIRAAVGDAAARVPVLTFATDLPGSARHVHVGPDDRMAGRLAGDLMGRLVSHAAGHVLLLAGVREMAGQRSRAEGFAAVLAGRYPRLRVGAVLECREDPARARQLLRRVLPGWPKLAGIYCSSVGAREATEVLRDAGRAGEAVVITHELTPGHRRLLRSGALDAVIDQNPAAAVGAAVATMAHLLGRALTEPPPPVTPLSIHMIENAG